MRKVLVLVIAVVAGLFSGVGGDLARAQGPAPVAREASPASRIAAAMADFQRTANREIGRRLQAIRNGQEIGPLLVGLMLAFLYGAVHAAGPGHGKIVVVGYLLSRDARIGRGLAMGAQTALLHVGSAIVVVMLADILLRRTFGGAPAEIPAVRIASYALIVTIGLGMLVRAGRRLVAARATRVLAHEADRPPDHAHLHRHAPDCGCGLQARAGEGGLLAAAVGLVPCTGSLLILLYALANDMLAVGIALVAAIAFGMAITMGVLGLASVWARRFVLDRLERGRAKALVAGLLEVAGAGLVTAAGGLLLVGSL